MALSLSKRDRNVLLIFFVPLVAFIVIGFTIASINDAHNQASTAQQPAIVLPQPDPPPPQKPLTAAEKRKAEAEAKNAAKEQAAQEEFERILYAKTYENTLLDQGMDAEVTAFGPKHKYLKVKYILVGRVLVHQIDTNQQELFPTFEAKGFQRFYVTDGYDQTTYWNLN